MKRLLFLTSALVLIISYNTSAQNFFREKNRRDNSFGLGIGPSFIYADNGGQYSILNFKWRPSFSLVYDKRLSPHMAFRTTGGTQWISSWDKPLPSLVERWKKNEDAVSFRGNLYFVDVMPYFNLLPDFHHMIRPEFNIYTGLGFGVMLSSTNQKFALEDQAPDSRSEILTPYIPFRGGLNFKTADFWDISLEGTILMTFTDKIDGNTSTHTQNDIPFQIQIIVRKYLNQLVKSSQ